MTLSDGFHFQNWFRMKWRGNCCKEFVVILATIFNADVLFQSLLCRCSTKRPLGFFVFFVVELLPFNGSTKNEREEIVLTVFHFVELRRETRAFEVFQHFFHTFLLVCRTNRHFFFVRYFPSMLFSSKLDFPVDSLQHNLILNIFAVTCSLVSRFSAGLKTRNHATPFIWKWVPWPTNNS